MHKFKIKMSKIKRMQIGRIFVYALGWIGAAFAGFVCLIFVRDCANGYPLLANQSEVLLETVFKIGFVAGGLGVCSLFLLTSAISPTIKWLWYKGKHKPKGFLKLI